LSRDALRIDDWAIRRRRAFVRESPALGSIDLAACVICITLDQNGRAPGWGVYRDCIKGLHGFEGVMDLS